MTTSRRNSGPTPLIASALLALLAFSACAARPPRGDHQPNDGRTAIRLSGESCRLDLDGDSEPDSVEINVVRGKRTAKIELTRPGAQPHFEELSTLQHVECVSNQEPGVPVRGTDESEKAVSVPIMNDYLRFEKAQSSAKLMYFDGTSQIYRSIYQAD